MSTAGTWTDSAVAALARHHVSFLLHRLVVFPLVLGEDMKRGMPLLLECNCGFYVQDPSVPVERRHRHDTRLPRNASPLVVAVAIQELDIRLILCSPPNTP
ncbi:hypothetical protein CDV31_017282 [Fusarium ambrosium]|uniref:Uncharacterized protein n=1 Tax=Fusarium ambrosium TaxID=131363 RepID=A0A428RKT0_9HYPO|nr:hypothetical protein CDV31_017282 [Fusarium ambrosium]